LLPELDLGGPSRYLSSLLAAVAVRSLVLLLLQPWLGVETIIRPCIIHDKALPGHPVMMTISLLIGM